MSERHSEDGLKTEIERVETLQERVRQARWDAPPLSKRYHELDDREKRLGQFKRYLKLREKFGGV